MSVLTAIFVYFLIWWITIFTILPLGIERDDQPEAGNDKGAPKKADFKRKIVLNTIVSAVILAIIWGLMELGAFDAVKAYLRG